MIEIPLHAAPASAGQPPGAAEPAPGVAARFCGRCGGAVEPDVACAPCAARPVVRADQSRRDRRALVSPLALYAFLLLTLVGGSVYGRLAGARGAFDSIVFERYLLAAHAVVVLLWCLFHRDAVADGLHTLPKRGWFALAAVVPLGTFAVAQLGVWGLAEGLGVPVQNYSGDYLAAGYGWGYILLVVAVQPAVVEELAFRGVILGGLRRVFGVTQAVVVSALLFMMLHLAPLSFPHLLVIGLTLGFMRVRSGSVYPGMLAHFLHNALVLGSEHFLG